MKRIRKRLDTWLQRIEIRLAKWLIRRSEERWQRLVQEHVIANMPKRKDRPDQDLIELEEELNKWDRMAHKATLAKRPRPINKPPMPPIDPDTHEGPYPKVHEERQPDEEEND